MKIEEKAENIVMKKKKEVSIFLTALSFRGILYAAAALLMLFQAKEGGFSLDTFLNAWCRWDANHYLNLAKNGYQGAVEVCETCREALLGRGIGADTMENGQHLFLVFFPLFPYLMRLVGLLFGDMRIAGMILSAVTYAGGCVYMYRLARLDYSEKTAMGSVTLLSFFPFGFFFGGIMSEGVFFLTSAAAMYYLRSHRWWRGIFWGSLASLCRMQGALLIIFACLELLSVYRPWQMLRNRDFSGVKNLLGRGMSLLLMLSGTGIYLWINWKVEGHPFRFMIYQKSHWNQGICTPVRTLSYVFRNAFSASYSLSDRAALWIPQAVLAVAAAAILIRGRKKLYPAGMGYALSYVLLTYSVTWLLSAGRYLSCCIPLFIALAAVAEKRKWLMKVLTVLFLVLQVVYLAGYLNGMQIM